MNHISIKFGEVDRRKGRGLEPSVMIRFAAVTILCAIRPTPEDKPCPV